MAKLTKEELEIIEKIFDNPWAKDIYGGSEFSYIKEVEKIKDMTEEELREKYPMAYYWVDRWKKETI